MANAEKLKRRRMVKDVLKVAVGITIGGGLMAGYIGYGNLSRDNDALRAAITQMAGSSTPTPGATSTPETIYYIPFTSTPLPTSTPETIPVPDRMTEWLNFWPDTPEKVAQMCGGDTSQWQRNPEWPDSKAINNPALGIINYVNREWRPISAENLPFDWPKTPEEAVNYFFPGQNINPIFMQPAWIDPNTGLATGWHLSEDHWLVDGSPADVTLILHPCEVGEGYTVAGTLDPKDDRNWVAFGGKKESTSGGIAINLAKGQGMTMWMPGTDPNAVALRMELFVGADTPHYRGPNGEQLGPDPIGFTPVYLYPKDNTTGFIGPRFIPVKTGLETMNVKGSLTKQLGGGNPQTVRRPQDHGKSAVAFQRNPFKGIRGV